MTAAFNKITPLTKWLALQAVMGEVNSSALVVAAALLDCHNGKTGQCNPSHATLARKTGLTRRTVIAAVRLLELRGWYEVDRERQSRGAALTSNGYRFNWTRVPSENFAPNLVKNSAPRGEDFVTRGSEKPGMAPGAESDFPPCEKNSTQNSEEYRTTESRNGESRIGEVNPLSDGEGPDSESFDVFWRQYPRKVAKEAAKRAYEKVVGEGRATPIELINGAMRYAAERAGQDPKFTKHPTTWLNAGCWADEPTTTAAAVGKQTSSTRNAVEAILSTAKPGSVS